MPTAAVPNAQQLAVIRQAFAGAQQLCSDAEQLLDEPFRSMFTSIKRQFDEKLTAMPPTEQVPAALDMNYQLQSLHWCLESLTQMVRTLNQQLSGMKTATASAITAAIEAQIKEGKLFNVEGLNSAVAAEVKRRTDAGEILPKDTVTQMCSTSEANGITKGEKKVRDELAAQAELAKKIGERKTGCTTASMPLPANETLLGGTDEEFATRRTTAEGRVKELKDAGFSLNADLLANVWLPEGEYKNFRAMIDTVPGLKGPGVTLAGAGASRKESAAQPANVLII